MKHSFKFLFMALVIALSFASCHHAEDIISGLDKKRSQAYLHNESGQDVSVYIRPDNGVKRDPYFVPKDAVVEIPDVELWGLEQRAYASDSVVFIFADGTRLVHSFVNPYYGGEGQSKGIYIYTPKENNIFKAGIEVPSEQWTWKSSKVKPSLMRYDYTIK